MTKMFFKATRFSPSAQGLMLGLGFCGILGATACQSNPGPSFTNPALVLGPSDSLGTDILPSEFLSSDFTLGVWMYPLATHGPSMELIGQKDGRGFSMGIASHYSIDKDESCANDDGHPSRASSRLYVQLNSFQAAIYCVPIQNQTWSQVSVVGRYNHQLTPATLTLEMYLNGKRLLPQTGKTDIVVPVNSWQIKFLDLSSPLNLGQAQLPQNMPGEVGGQFIGYIDDVVVYRRALDSLSDLAQMSALTGKEDGLVAAISFDSESGDATSPAPLSRQYAPLDSQRKANLAFVTEDRDSEADRSVFEKSIPLLTAHHGLTLPFAANQVWKVLQGNDSAMGSHRDYAAYCWDLISADGVAPGGFVDQKNTAGMPVHAAVTAPVYFANECTSAAPSAPANSVGQKVSESLYVSYLHLITESVHAFLGEGSDSKPLCNRNNLDIPISVGTEIGLAGDTGLATPGGYHIHFGATDRPKGADDAVTVPVAFSNYEASNDQGRSWHSVSTGFPTEGQWIRHP